MSNGEKWYDAAGHVKPHSGAEKLSDGKVRLRSGRVVDQNTYDRFAGPLEVTVVAGPRKTALVFVLDQYGLPWTWETPEGILEERLRVFDERVYKQFLRDHPPAREMVVPAGPYAGTMGKPSAGESVGSSLATASGETLPEGAFPISRSRAHTHRRHGHPLQTVPSAGLIERPQEKNRVDALR